MTPIVVAEFLTKRYGSGRRSGGRLAVDDVSFEVRPGESFGIVGESGSGKTTVSRILLGLVRPTSGRVAVDGIDVWNSPRPQRLRLPGTIQIVFQDPYSSMDPRMRIGQIVAESFHARSDAVRHREEVGRLLDLVGLPAQYSSLLPRQLSGGQRQRVAIARALGASPRVLVADEPVSALDVSMRGQILNLLADLRESEGLTCILISHDLGVVRQFCDRVIVMSRGRIVEEGDPARIFDQPHDQYTRTLVSSIPVLPGRRS